MSETPIEIVGRWRRYRDRRDKGVEWRAWESLGPLQDEGYEFVLLWSLALEVDEHRATRTAEQVCRACGARGVKITRLSTSITIWHEPDPDGVVRTLTHDPCRCTGPTRPHTVSLRRLVSTLASWRSPIVTDWPEQWAINRDRMEAAAWGEVTLPGDDRPTPAWVCQWWRAFGEWTAAGKVSDVGALAKALESRIKRAVPLPTSFVVTDDGRCAGILHPPVGNPLVMLGDDGRADVMRIVERTNIITGGDVVSVGSPPAAHWVTPHDASQLFNDDRERSGRALADLNDGNRMLVVNTGTDCEECDGHGFFTRYTDLHGAYTDVPGPGMIPGHRVACDACQPSQPTAAQREREQQDNAFAEFMRSMSTRNIAARAVLSNANAPDSDRCMAALWLRLRHVTLLHASPWTLSIEMPTLMGDGSRWTFAVSDRHIGRSDTGPEMVADLHHPTTAERDAIGEWLDSLTP